MCGNTTIIRIVRGKGDDLLRFPLVSCVKKHYRISHVIVSIEFRKPDSALRVLNIFYHLLHASEIVAIQVVNAENTDKGFGFVRLENDKGFSVMNSLIRTVMTHPFKGRHLQIELR